MRIRDYKIPETDITELFSDLQLFQYYDKYSRFLWEEGRREDWHETIARAVDFLRHLSEDKLVFSVYQDLFTLMYLGEVTPSMRLLNMAGPAAERDNACLYNCTYMAVDCLAAFDEMLSLSMSGCGVGFSVESYNVEKLPMVSQQHGFINHFRIPDNQWGWQESIKILMNDSFLYGIDTIFDYSELRPSGTPLYTKGGYSSGPEILQQVHDRCKTILRNAQGRHVTTLEAFDLMTILPEAGISGGVRRAATIALFDHWDNDMLNAKTGNFAANYPNRYNANISAVWPNQVSIEDVDRLTEPLFSNGYGEPGIFKRDVALKSCDRRIWTDERKVGVNPCGEIIMNDTQFCNLSTVICHPEDTLASLSIKTQYATLIGDIQSLASHFPYLRPEWAENAKRERILGVCHVGHANCPAIRSPLMQEYLKQVARETDLLFSQQFGVVPSAAITAVKPSGNTSTLYNVGPGINPIHDEFSKRNVTVAKSTAMYRFLLDYAVPVHNYEGKPKHVMFTFPYKAPENSILLENRTGLMQLEYWALVKQSLTEHNPSCSITYDEWEIPLIKRWLYDNQNIIGGIALFPRFDNSYPLMPIEKINEEEYEQLLREMPNIDWSIFHDYESQDESTKFLECSGGRCDIPL